WARGGRDPGRHERVGRAAGDGGGDLSVRTGADRDHGDGVVQRGEPVALSAAWVFLAVVGGGVGAAVVGPTAVQRGAGDGGLGAGGAGRIPAGVCGGAAAVSGARLPGGTVLGAARFAGVGDGDRAAADAASGRIGGAVRVTSAGIGAPGDLPTVRGA